MAVIIGIIYVYTFHWFLSHILLQPPMTVFFSLIPFVCIYAVAVLLQFRQRNNRKADTLEEVLNIFAAGAMPSIPLFHYVAINILNFNFSDCLILCVLLGIVSITLYLLVSVKGDKRLSLLSVLLVWVLFWVYPHVIKLYPNKIVFWVLALFIIGISVYFAHTYHLDRLTGNALAGVVCLLFLFNIGNATIKNIQANKKTDNYRAKTVFSVDTNTPHPDIYWFHMDGMMGFDTIESLYKDSQSELKDYLSARGFKTNNSASLDVGWTAYSIPALTSPTIYVDKIKPLMDNMPNMTDYERKKQIGADNSIYMAYKNLELFSSFNQAGYDVYHILNDIGRSFESIPVSYNRESDFSFDKS